MRVLIRGQVCELRRSTDFGTRKLLTLEDVDTGEALEVLCPPEEYEVLTEPAPGLDRRALTPLQRWLSLHGAVCIQTPPDGYAGFVAGRIAPEPYQFAPISRLLSGARRGLLIADDVGLGKTIEAGICLLELMARGIAKRTLLVVPPALIPQWLDEMWEKFGLRFQPIENASALDRAQTSVAEGLQPWVYFDRVITSTEYLKRRDVMVGALARPWDVVVVDEAHYLIESGSPASPYATARTRLGRRLREAARTLLLLTATPHNGYRHSFRSLLELADPAEATLHGRTEDVQRRVGRIMIRRLKSQIMKSDSRGGRVPAFPARQPVGRIEVKGLSPAERDIFRLVTEYCAKAIESAEKGEESDLVSFAMQIVKKRMLSSRAALHQTVENRLKALGARDVEVPPKRGDLRELQSDLPLPEAQAERTALKVLRAAITRDARRRSEEKKRLRTIVELLVEVGQEPDPKIAALIADLEHDVLPVPGEKAIVFTEYRDTLDALRKAFSAHPVLAESFVELTGGLTARQRRMRIAGFHEPDCRILLATDAASEGLNLQEQCRRVYHFELPWNPNRLEQRNGRVDRHGQTRSPIVRYLFYPDSPEDRVLDRLVQRLNTMSSDQVATPDILGILESTRIETVLSGIESVEDGERKAEALIRRFDEAREVFSREMAPLLVAGVQDQTPTPYADPTLADPILADDTDFQTLMVETLRPALRSAALPGTWRIEVPRRLQGPEVIPCYECATFQRSVATRYPADQVEYIHRLHPLARAVAEQALHELTLEPARNQFAARIAVRRSNLADQALAVFTFLDRQSHAHERVFGVAICADGRPLASETAERLLGEDSARSGEVAWSECEQTFAGVFPALQYKASEAARAVICQGSEREGERMRNLAKVLREEAALYKVDRLAEIDEQERSEIAGSRDQMELFREAKTNWDARRAAVETHYTQRLQEINRLATVPQVAEPQPLGVMLVFPPA